MADFVFTVSEVNGYVKKVLEAEELLRNIKIRGEISNFSKSFAGHMYFTLKDESASVQCVWFAGSAKNTAINLKDGDRVQVTASVTLYIIGGTYQLVVKSVEKDGTGDIYERFEKLKKSLEAQGLFDLEHKKPLPAFPSVVGVITSSTGAAIQDITRVLDSSWGNVTMRLYPVSVQGELAAGQMIKALDYFNKKKAADVIIIGRGGGSFEDLNCFNDEALAYKIFECEIPIISAVGHETDFTICDFVADVREATPSTAAKRAVPQKSEELQRLKSYKKQFESVIFSALDKGLLAIKDLDNTIKRYNPNNILMQAQQRLDFSEVRISGYMRTILDRANRSVSEYSHRFEALNPDNTLKRGYAIIEDKHSQTLSGTEAIRKAKQIKVRMHDGNVNAVVTEE